jgi:hypothetical protein
MKKKLLLLGILVLMLSIVSGQTVRSELYPENWAPGFTDAQGRFLHDFSYAGYGSGLLEIPTINTNVVDITQPPYLANNTGETDVRTIIQKALDDVGKAGGGIVYLPQGIYKINVSATSANPIKITYKNVILRGSGPDKTFIYNDNANVRGISVITVKPTTGGDWVHSRVSTVNITQDLLNPTTIIPVSSVSNYKIGDCVVLWSNVTTEFIAEHEMEQMWSTTLPGTMFYRIVVDVDATNNTLTVDAPTRYYLKLRDGAKVSKVTPVLSEVGLEDFSIGNRQSALSGFGNLDFNVAGTGAYEVHGSHLIGIYNAINCWARNIHTYKPSVNPGDFHLGSNGIRMERSRFVTIESCTFEKTQYKGEGGNGYMFTLRGNDCLIKNSRANSARHNYDFSTMQCSGNVVLNCRGENSTLASDFHMFLSMANLFDNFTANKDFLEAKFRPWGGFPTMHGHPTTQSVFWNTNGEAYQNGKNYIVDSQQFGWGYVIGTRGPASEVRTAPVSGTLAGYEFNSAPEDFSEHIGNGSQLEPQSLYEDQLLKRIERNATSIQKPLVDKTDEHITISPNPSNSGSVNVTSANAIGCYRLINSMGKLVVQKSGNFGNCFDIDIPQKGLYVLQLVTAQKPHHRKVLAN